MLTLGGAVSALILMAPGPASALPVPPVHTVDPSGWSGSGTPQVQLQLKLSEASAPELDPQGRIRGTSSLEPFEAAQQRYGLRFRPLFPLAPERLAALRTRAQDLSGRPQPDLRTCFFAVSDRSRSIQDWVSIGRSLQQLPEVDWVWLEPLALPPPAMDLAPPTPDYTAEQDYFDPNEGGYDLSAARARNLTGAGVRVADVEYGWVNDHEDVSNVFEEPNQTIAVDLLNSFFGPLGWQYHGAAVLGIMAARQNPYGVTGAAPDADMATYPEYTEEELSRRPAAVASAAADSQVGDVVVLEMQTVGRPGGNFVPAELSPGVFMAVQMATDAGVVVTAAAGNGNENLDIPAYNTYRQRGDSGAIIVGAGSADPTHRKLNFSTYGSRVDVQGWGTQVASIGYGDLAALGSDQRQTYTRNFGGTSSATPVVTGVVLLVQELARQVLGRSLTSVEMRRALVETGIPQGGDTSRPIGPFPDLEGVLQWVENRQVRVEPLQVMDVPEGSEVVLEAEAQVAAGGPLSFEWSVGGTPQVGPRVTWPALDDQEVAVELTVRSAFGVRVQRSAFFRVNNVPPLISVEPLPEVVEGDPVQQPLQIEEPGADTLRFEISGDLDSAQVQGSTLTFIPTYADAQRGRVALSVAVFDDDGGSDQVDFELPVRYRDEDQDGVPDTWERRFGFDPTDPLDARTDPDGDGRNQLEEFSEGSDPTRDDRPLAPEAFAPPDGAVVSSLDLQMQARTSTAPHRIRLLNEDGSSFAESSTLTPDGQDRIVWSPSSLPAENARITWEGVAFDRYAESDPSPARRLVYSQIPEPPPIPQVVDAQTRVVDEQVFVDLELTVGPDPEGQPVSLEARIQVGSRTLVQTEVPAETPNLSLQTRRTPGLTWSVRAVDSAGTASEWTEPVGIPGLEDCSCSSTATHRGAWTGLMALGVLGLRFRRPRRQYRGSSSSRM